MANRPPRGGSSQPTSYPPIRVRIKKGDVVKVTPPANQPSQGTGNSSNIHESQLVAQAAPNSTKDTKPTEDDGTGPKAHDDKANHDFLTGPSESDTTNFNRKKSSKNK